MRYLADTNPPTPATLPVADPTTARRAAIAAAVETYNRAHPNARLPRSAARLLLAMFPADDEFRGSHSTKKLNLPYRHRHRIRTAC